MSKLSPALSTRLMQAAQAVLAVQQGHSMTEVLGKLAPEDRPSTQALAFTVLRRLGAACAARHLLVKKDPTPQVNTLLLTTLALLMPGPVGPVNTEYPEHTLVDQTVTAVKQVQPHSAGFVNAVLRRFLRERETISQQLLNDPVAQTNHPLWWIKQLEQDWPMQSRQILQANNQQAPLCLRVNARWGSACAYLEHLQATGIEGLLIDHPLLKHAVKLNQAVAVSQLPLFEQGAVSVQDLAAQMAAPLLLGSSPIGQHKLAAGARVLDACAAPGGKTAHLLEMANLEVLALDIDATRLMRVNSNLQRLRLHATTALANAADPDLWWDGVPFDAILLDAPCSASGVVRRHPDIRWLRRPSDLLQFQERQIELLRKLWPLLKTKGRLLFATCSVFLCEGPQVIANFLHEQANAFDVTPIKGSLLPGLGPDELHFSIGDGFFYALLEKK